MTAGSYGPLRATDADRENVHALLQSAYADGRLTWDEFDSRSTALLAAKTYTELATITTDLRPPATAMGPQPYQPVALGVRPRTNPLAIVSLVCGIGQIFIWVVGPMAAIILGHIARSQIRKNGEDGAGLALAGLILGYIGLGIPLLIATLVLSFAH
jgi:hypothetical protein